MAEAVAEISLDASKYEAGIERVKKSSTEGARESERKIKDLGDTAERVFRKVGGGAERVRDSSAKMAAGLTDGTEKVRMSYRQLSEEARRLGREVAAEHKRIADSERGLARERDNVEREGGHGGGMNSAMRRQMMMHSGRAILDSTMAGASPLQAIEMQAPRLAETLGIGLGPMAGVAALATVLAKAASGYMDAKKAREEFANSGNFINSKSTPSQEYDKQIAEVIEARNKNREQNGFWSKFGEKLKNVPAMMLGGDSTTPEERKQLEVEATKTAEILRLQQQKVYALQRENQFREDNIRLGEHAAKIAQIERDTKLQVDEAIKRGGNKDAPELSTQNEVNEIRRAGLVRKQEAEYEQQTYRNQLTLHRKLSEIENPGVTTGAGFDRDAARQYANLKSVAAATAEYSEALSELARAKTEQRPLDEPRQRVLDAENRLNTELVGQKEKTWVLREQAEIQKLQLSGQSTAATNAGQLLTLESAITSARQAGDTAAATTLQSRKDQLTAAQNLQYFLHPELGRAEQAASQQRERDQRKSDLAGGFLNPRRDMSGNLLGGIDPRTGQYRDATEAERTAAKAAERRGPYTFHRATNSPENSPFSIPDNAEIPDVADIGSFGAEFGDAAGHRDAALRRNPGPRRIRPGDPDWEPVNKPWRTGGGWPRRMDERGSAEPRRRPSVLDSLGYHFPGEGLNKSHIPYRDNFAEQMRETVKQDPMQGVGSVVAALQAVTPQLATLVTSLQTIANKVGTA